MDIEIKNLTHIEMDKIMALYIDAEWTNYIKKPDLLKRAYENSLEILGAYDGDKLVGVIRVVGDGYSIIYIQDIIVLEAYQRMGIGKKLLYRIIEKYSGVYQMVLLTENQPKTVGFYKALGFTADSDIGCMAFVRHNT